MYIIYGKDGCSYCVKAKDLVIKHGKEFTYIDIGQDVIARNYLIKQGFKSLPQIYFDDFHIGSFNDLKNHIVLNNS